VVFRRNQVQVLPTGEFAVENVIGVRTIRVEGAPPGWIVKSITIGGQNVLDLPIAFKPTTCTASRSC
jgi:hypothetical protein